MHEATILEFLKKKSEQYATGELSEEQYREALTTFQRLAALELPKERYRPAMLAANELVSGKASAETKAHWEHLSGWDPSQYAK